MHHINNSLAYSGFSAKRRLTSTFLGGLPRIIEGKRVEIDYIFTTRGDIFHTSLDEELGAKLDGEGQTTASKAPCEVHGGEEMQFADKLQGFPRESPTFPNRIFRSFRRLFGGK